MKETVEWELGQWGERQARSWCEKQGWFVIPAYLIEDGGAPAATRHLEKLVLPDLQVAVNGEARWIEVKTKTLSPVYQKTGDHRHGVDLRNWEAYLEVEAQTGIPGYLMIVQLEPHWLLMASFAHLLPVVQVYGDMAYWPRDRFERLEVRADGPSAPRIEPKAEHPWPHVDDGHHDVARTWDVQLGVWDEH